MVKLYKEVFDPNHSQECICHRGPMNRGLEESPEGDFVDIEDYEELKNQLAKANERVRELESVRDEMRNSFYSRFLDYRGLTIEQACKHCSGSGVKVYGNTSTWRMGIGGQMITPDVCDNCWGSGNADKPWANLRQLRKEQE